MNILIVDDDATSRLVLNASLEKLGHSVTTVSTGAAAWALFEADHVPLLISDLVMPDFNGIELCQRIRAADRPRYTYIIMLTSVGGKSGFLEGMRAGVDDFMTKPYDEEQLTARLIVAERILNLQSQVNQLSGLLPICCVCNKIRDDKNYWHRVESYIAQRTDAQFSHGYCPACLEKALQEVAQAKAQRALSRCPTVCAAETKPNHL